MNQEQTGTGPDRQPESPGPSEQAVGANPELDDADAPRIWVGSLLDYNNGVLHGDWIAADQDTEALQSDIDRMLAASPTTARTGQPAAEWGILDYENYGSLRLGESEPLSWVSTVARGISEHGPAFAAWADVMQDEDALDGFEDAYRGHHDSLQEYAAQLIDDLGYDDVLDQALPEPIRRYVNIDTAALGRDMELGGDIHGIPADDGGVWIFDAH